MKVSLNAIRQLVDFDLPPVDELIKSINEQLGGVEEVIDLGRKYEGAVIVKVVECQPLEGSDHLNVVKIDDSGVVKDVDRDDKGLAQVVCGAPNVRSGMYAVWLAPGVTVPASFDDAEPFVLSARQLRGVVSNGMLASPKELAFGDLHEGILEIDPDENIPGKAGAVQPGAHFAELYGLNDYVIDIENKMFTHRPDCFGVLGVAREIAGILHRQFKSPEWYIAEKTTSHSSGLALEVENAVPEKVSRFMAVAVKDVVIKPSPIWLQAELVRLGAKPISNIVDITNYMMLLTAQPMHAYDYDKVKTAKLGVRLANDGEALTLLGGKTISLNKADIIITDGQRPIGLAGVMGGADTEVSTATRNIILECATFDMFTIRRTSMRHGLFTDASTRFTKGQSLLQNRAVIQKALQLVAELTGGVQASSLLDQNREKEVSDATGPMTVDEIVETTFINERLGLQLSAVDIQKLLGNVEFSVHEENKDGKLNYRAPFWRTDIHLAEDIVEEVGRLYGFHHLPQELPRRSIQPSPENSRRQLKARLRQILSIAGANEVLTYSFVHRSLLEKAGQDTQDAFQLSNALSPDLHYLRLTVLPSLIEKVHPNVRAGYDRFALFEIGKGHSKKAGRDEQGVPLEQEYVASAFAGGGFYDAKAALSFLAEKLHLSFSFKPIKDHPLFEAKRSARVLCNDTAIGFVGELRSTVRRQFKLPELSAGFELELGVLLDAVTLATSPYRALSKFPSVERDLTLKVEESVPFEAVERALQEAIKPINLMISLNPVTIYQPEAGQTKNLTFHISLVSFDKTLTSDEANDVMRAITDYATSKVGAAVV